MTSQPAPAPTEVEIRAALEKILRSEQFQSTARASGFLRYVVTETLAGRGDDLKAQAIAVEVFDKEPDFDTQNDPIVRVEAGRLRRRLYEYYHTVGRDDETRIELPRGGYVPTFSRIAATPSGDAAPAKRDITLTQALVALASIAALASVVLTLWLIRPDPLDERIERITSVRERAPRLLVLPFSNVSGDSSLDYFAFGTTEELAVQLNDYELTVITSQVGVSNEDSSVDIASLRERLDFSYLLTGTVNGAGEQLRITARLVDAASGTQIWSQEFNENASVSTLLRIERDVAESVATTVSVPFGPIFQNEGARITASTDEMESYECVLRFYYFTYNQDPNLERELRACFERAVALEPGFADGWAGIAHSLIYQYRFGFSPGRTDLLTEARTAAGRALDIDGTSRLAHLAMLRIRFYQGDMEGFEATVERLLEIAPRSPDSLALIGFLLIVADQAERGLPLADKAIELTWSPPGWFFAGYAIQSLREGDYPAALSWARRVDSPNWYIAPLLVAVSAGLADDTEAAQRAARRLLELYPDFEAAGRAEIDSWRFEESLVERVKLGLARAGITIE